MVGVTKSSLLVAKDLKRLAQLDQWGGKTCQTSYPGDRKREESGHNHKKTCCNSLRLECAPATLLTGPLPPCSTKVNWSLLRCVMNLRVDNVHQISLLVSKFTSANSMLCNSYYNVYYSACVHCLSINIHFINIKPMCKKAVFHSGCVVLKRVTFCLDFPQARSVSTTCS